jgi:RNA polymerase sigma factor (sigma-70 family)
VNAAAIDRLYRDHGHVVLRRARELLRSDVEALDACQEIFLGLLQRPEQLAGVTRLTAWLYRATTHHCLNQLRNRRGRMRLLAALVPVRTTAATVPARADQIAQVRDLLARLPEPLAEVAIYHFVDGMTYDEIAAMLDCSRRKVGYLIERLRAAMTGDAPAAVAGWPEEQET